MNIKVVVLPVVFSALFIGTGCDKPDYDRGGGPDPTQRGTGSGGSSRNQTVAPGSDAGQGSVNAGQIQPKQSTDTTSSDTRQFNHPHSGTGSRNP